MEQFLGIVLMILWIILPFVILSMHSKLTDIRANLRQINEELKKGNKIQADVRNFIRITAGPKPKAPAGD